MTVCLWQRKADSKTPQGLEECGGIPKDPKRAKAGS